MVEHPTLELRRAAELIGGYRWLEHRLFEITGVWSALAHDPLVRLHLFEASHQHAWHAELWADRLPMLADADADSLTVPYGPAAAPFVSALATTATGSLPPASTEPSTPDAPSDGHSASSADVARLAALYRIAVPRLVSTYGRHRERANPVTDGPTIRALTLVLRDETESWQSGEALLESLLGSPELVQIAAETQHRLESILVGAGIRTGLAAWPVEGGER
jgi:hypothetical protein